MPFLSNVAAALLLCGRLPQRTSTCLPCFPACLACVLLGHMPRQPCAVPNNVLLSEVVFPTAASPSADGGMEEGADSQGQPRGLGGSSLGAPSRTTAAGNPYGPPAGRRLVARAASPPCLRNMFSGAEGDGQLVGGGAAVAPAPASAPGSGGLGLSRFRADFKEAGILGQGAFSKVFRARHRLDGQEYAVKRSIAEVVPGSLAVRQWVQEVQALAAVPPHPHLVQYYSAWREPGDKGGEHLYIQLERCDATLADHAGLGGELREADLLDLLAQTTAALAHLHAHGIAHLDVKPDNIYIRYGEDDAPAFKLGDFGQAAAADGRGPAVVSEGDSRCARSEGGGCEGRWRGGRAGDRVHVA